MRKNLHALLVAVALTATATATELSPLPQQSKALKVSSEILGHYHYRALPLDDALSEQIFDKLIASLDPEKYYFTQTDLAALLPVRDQLDDAIRDGDLLPPFRIYNRYLERAGAALSDTRQRLESVHFDFTQADEVELSRKDAVRAANTAELGRLWQKRLKSEWLQLRLDGQKDEAIRETLLKRYANAISRLQRQRSEDAFEAFMNAYTTAIEPHTNYLGPRASADMDISMRLSLVGIGAVLREVDAQTIIQEVTPGSPAAASGQLKAGDRILRVGQGDDGPLVDVHGWRLEDTVALIRGETDTVVRLDILPANSTAEAPSRAVRLVRKKISLEQQAARKAIIELPTEGKVLKIGVITLPGFYEDFNARQRGDPDFRSATRDVERLLGELRQAAVDGVVIDLRGNGGGSLKEAIQLTGLFIDQGPVLMERNARGQLLIDGDRNAGMAWEGPLAVLINGDSASASEIFAAAIQDYGRGLIVGEPSYGKGTVQTVISLDQILKSEKPVYGDLKFTIAQFFRINGSTTQLKGVLPDIALPGWGDQKLNGEASHDNAIPWQRIRATDYDRIGHPEVFLKALQQRHDQRVQGLPEFARLNQEADKLRAARQRNRLSLEENTRRGELEGLRPNAHGESAPERDAAKADDALLRETALILADEIGLLRKSVSAP